jgi:hypothetical protein
MYYGNGAIKVTTDSTWLQIVFVAVFQKSKPTLQTNMHSKNGNLSPRQSRFGVKYKVIHYCIKSMYSFFCNWAQKNTNIVTTKSRELWIQLKKLS